MGRARQGVGVGDWSQVSYDRIRSIPFGGSFFVQVVFHDINGESITGLGFVQIIVTEKRGRQDPCDATGQGLSRGRSSNRKKEEGNKKNFVFTD